MKVSYVVVSLHLAMVIGSLGLIGAQSPAGGVQGSPPSANSSVCSIPGGRSIDAPEVPPGLAAQGLFGDIGTAVDSIISFFGRKLLQAAAVPPCCPSQTVRPGDTLASLAEQGGLPANSGSTLIKNFNSLTTDTLNPGDTITIPCARVISYIVMRSKLAPAPAPSG
ncbi:hypothetical protein ABBQ38_005887 [Trebouxia sp. C0009 RCD-2024]